MCVCVCACACVCVFQTIYLEGIKEVCDIVTKKLRPRCKQGRQYLNMTKEYRQGFSAQIYQVRFVSSRRIKTVTLVICNTHHKLLSHRNKKKQPVNTHHNLRMSQALVLCCSLSLVNLNPENETLWVDVTSISNQVGSSGNKVLSPYVSCSATSLRIRENFIEK